MGTQLKSDTIFEERKDFMISPEGDSNPILRKAHFLKPASTSSHESTVPKLMENFGAEKLRLNVSYSGWRCPQRKWKSWVNRLRPKHEATWRKAGIYESILSSTYDVIRNHDLILAVAEKWCCETNTFIFPWGEATITLEDMILLSGFPVLGESVLYSFDAEKIKECSTENAKQNEWLNQFYNESGYEFEHESFLVLWLSRFVFPGGYDLIRECVYPIADCLARGIKIALAPGVLASIYRDLSLLKAAIIVASSNLDSINEENHVLSVNISAPFQLVQIWIWGRFLELQPKPKLIQLGEPRFAKWHKVRTLKKTYDIKLVLDSAVSSFQWRPFNPSLNVYTNRSREVLVDANLDDEIHSFVRCIRVSELVGLDGIEQYLPHRVAMQFGFDQDLPGYVARSNETVDIAWGNYIRPIDDVKLYIPAKFHESDVTTRYFDWWRSSSCSNVNVQAQAGQGPSARTSDGVTNDENCISPNISSDVGKLKVTMLQSLSSLTGFIGTEHEHDDETKPLLSIQCQSSLSDGPADAIVLDEAVEDRD